ncbi:MAG: MFS transporter [Candidatus Omnitrophica bacterium]|nr:MFS transporter [Candidatus Omnitrophota bacterium]
MRRLKKVRQSVVYSYIEGGFASVMMGLRETFIIPFAVSLGAATSQVGLVSSIPNLLASLAQIKSADVTEKFRGRKKVISPSIFIHALMLLPIALIPFALKEGRIKALIFFYTLHLGFGNFAFPPWSSLISEYIPMGKRGKFFGFRNKILGFVAVVSSFLGGFLLSRLQKSNVFFGYGLIFLTALMARIISWHYINKMYEPAFKTREDSVFTFFEFVANIRRSNFTKFVFYVASMTFSVFLASPFFPVYMLRDIRMSYPTYTLVTMAATITILLAMDRWGKTADVFGNIKVLRICSFFIPIIPVLWLFSSNTFYLILVQIFAGFFWSGFNLAASNFIYDTVSPPKRTRCIAYFNVINGSAIFLGAITGGYCARFLPAPFGWRLLTLFLISGVMRMAVALFSFSLKEVRPVKKASGFKLLQETVKF